MGNGASIDTKGGHEKLSSIIQKLEEEYEVHAKNGLAEDLIMHQLKQRLQADNPDLYHKMSSFFLDDTGRDLGLAMTKSDIQVEVGSNRKPSLSSFADADGLSPVPHGKSLARSASGNSMPRTPRTWTRAESTQDLLQVQEACRTFMQRLALRTSHTYCVAIDGSEASNNCLKVGLMLQKGFDRLCVIHFYDPDKTASLPENLQPDALKQRYSEELASSPLSESQYSIQFLERSDIPPRTAMCHYINSDQGMEPTMVENADGSYSYDLGPSFLLVGCVGTRGPDDSPKVLGSVTDLALRSVTIPTIVVKKAPDVSKDQRVFVICIDGSDRAFNAYSITQTISRPRDKLILLYISSGAGAGSLAETEEGEEEEEVERGPDQGESLKAQYEKHMDALGIANGSFVIMHRELGKSIPEMIIAHCNEMAADFVVLSPHPKNRISSVTEAIIRDGPSNMIICKH
eukprot:CAMPEP_0117746780 /NCGR_PEP_ID=MMETSP0947-20121206/8141_1 /TAXON_ID=44440 /ORGANISM="Chattonella subsalsa, Strain CCMP2191" /LENGTH=458 /DNA_ID=CAMNT_0005564151 /DNA_START=276 /DNA_END=1652 /DNA_ORIENTATION=-